MLRQIKLLTGIQLCNLFGFNEARFTKDKKKKNNFTAMAAVWFFLIAMLIFYVSALVFGLISFGFSEVVPSYLAMITSLIIFIFTFFKASSVIFQMKTYETLVSLPLSRSAVVVSRFLSMYATDLALSFFVMLPGVVVYGIMLHPPVLFYVFSLAGTLLIPALPIIAATAVGAAVTAVSAKMKHKSLAVSLLTIFIAVVIVVASSLSGTAIEQIDAETLQNLTTAATGLIGKIYPPAVWFGDAAVNNNAPAFLLFLGVSLTAFVALIAVLQRYFLRICTALNATSAKNNYKMRGLKTDSVRKALWKREFKRYFDSSVYVSNTAMGYILMAVAAISITAVGAEKIEIMLNMPGVVQRALPVLLSFIAIIMPTTSCSISMEGRQWWIAQSLPLETKSILESKIAVNLTVAAPFYLIAVVASFIAVRPSPLGGVWLVLIPAAYILFSAVAGLTINLKLPMLDWDNEVKPVKQGAAGILTMLTGMVSVLPPFLCLVLLGGRYSDLVMGVTFAAVTAGSVVLMLRNNRRNLIYLGG